ncbi:YifB family Mg chelatase-like AAA ATPase [Lyticum sinuosum]|uniref:ATP-binding protein n=1 Tax=Lyticum sinuosum TaxID=1332059 RepID=A0AAE4VL47_9RICK|nr:YifB family Mg chelatase-like AAA ATPase [Lyticum sinuosum]MDZ5761468.1 ATP-binding protein [Lyticum sinuosum]
MLSNINTVTFIGIEANNIDVQTHIDSGGLPIFNIVGLADKSIAESKERVRAAFSSIGLSFPAKRITINLAPSDLLKEGSHFDLAIAMGLLTAMNIIPKDEIQNFIIMGELSLSGEINRVNGILPAAVSAKNANKGIICSSENEMEALYSSNNNIFVFDHLLEIIHHFTKKNPRYKSDVSLIDILQESNQKHLDLKDVLGQPLAKKGLEIAAAGRHHMIMIGQPGSGKSMLAKRLPSIMPPLSTEEILEINIIASIAGEIDHGIGLINSRPYRSPHPSSSMASLIGGGRNIRPGEITLAHYGILFLDELPEFHRNSLESLRQPVEDGYIILDRASGHVKYPAKFLLIAAMNPCKCGYYGSKINNIRCRKAPQCAYDYQNKISGPMFDRFDLQVQTDEINSILYDSQLYSSQESNESSTKIRERVISACDIQNKRYKKLGWEIKFNSELDGDCLNKSVILTKEAKNLLEKAITKFCMSMRSVNRVLKVSRTIADLSQNEGDIRYEDMLKSISYRINRMME